MLIDKVGKQLPKGSPIIAHYDRKTGNGNCYADKGERTKIVRILEKCLVGNIVALSSRCNNKDINVRLFYMFEYRRFLIIKTIRPSIGPAGKYKELDIVESAKEVYTLYKID